MTTGTPIEARLRDVRCRIHAACARVERSPADVEIIAVSKMHAPEAIRAAYAVGQRAFGENYVQELVSKAEAVRDLPEARFHFIGHLQRNKVKEIVTIGAAVDTVDSERLADALAKRAEGAGTRVEVSIQVNIGQEPQKSGCMPSDVPALVRSVRSLDALVLRGLMTVPPASDNAEDARVHFRALRVMAQGHGLSELSMGMSHDFEIAIEEGATSVRIGTLIFGERISAA